MLVGALLLISSCSSDRAVSNSAERPDDPRVAELAKIKDRVVPFFEKMHIEPLDWLESQHEGGQTFAEYVAAKPTLPTTDRKTIYIQPVGTFTEEQKRAMRLTADYMAAFYGLPVRLEREKKLGSVPKDKTRTVFPKNRQVRTAYFLSDVLPPLLPSDAAAFVCFTNFDLYPGDQWSFVFGQASLDGRVGVYSLYRLGGTAKMRVPFDKFVDRTLKVAMHETGHMFSMRHCTKYECLMSGTNNLAETDRRPLDNCPECMAKIAWGLNYDPAKRYEKLALFWAQNGRPSEQKKMLLKAAAIKGEGR